MNSGGLLVLANSRSCRVLLYEMTLRLKSIGPASVLQRYQQILRGYSTKRAEGRFTTNEKISASASAYEVLGLPEKCDATSIRMAFRKLAKATHPDLQSETSTVEFIRVLAAYEILSDPQKRAQYDENLRSKRAEQSRMNASEYRDASYDDFKGGLQNGTLDEQELADRSTEVVSWLKSYRAMVKDIIRRQEIGVGRGWEEDLRAETQSALKKAYFGPPVSELEGLPECFEAEERAQPDIRELLHLVSGRQLFGLVRQVQVPRLEGGKYEAPSLLHTHTDALDDRIDRNDPAQIFSEREYHTDVAPASDSTFVDLELQMFGNVVARSIRVPATEMFSDPSVSGADEGQDCIYIYLSSEQVEEDGTNLTAKRIFLGSVRGLGSSKVGNVCNVYGPDGKKSHLILQHRTPMVRHMQWFRIGEDSAPCECRCRRASVIPSRYWIFEPRTETHNVGGWYIETFGQNRRSVRGRVKNQPEEHQHERPMYAAEIGGSKMLHPAMYILAAAYKTLDEEAAQRRKGSISTRLKTSIGLHKFSWSLSEWWRRRWSSSVWP